MDRFQDRIAAAKVECEEAGVGICKCSKIGAGYRIEVIVSRWTEYGAEQVQLKWEGIRARDVAVYCMW